MGFEEAGNERVAAADKVGDLGRYRLIAELARGGMGIVYLALVRGPGGFNKLLVVKELKAHLAEDANLVRMFLEEARLAAKLSHPNVVQTIEVGSENGRHFLAMEHLDGQSLQRALVRSRRVGRPLPFPYFLHVLAHALEGLRYAHSVIDFDGAPLDLVHRDVSPHNVMVTYDGQVKVLDFGIAKAMGSAHDTRTGVLKGKVAYMAPEQAKGEAIDRRADVFSAGVMLFEAATGTRMWSGAENDLQILHALMQGDVPRPRDAKGDLDPAVERVILKATAPRREARYASAAEMQADVEALLAASPAPPFGAREVGRFFAELFAADRARIQQVIDDQLGRLRRTTSGEHEKIDLPQLASLAAPSGTPSGVQLALEETSGSGRKRSPVAPIVGVAAIVVLLGVAVTLRRSSEPPRAPRALDVATAPAPIRVVVEVSPHGATVSIDDGAPHVGSLVASLPRDAATHALRVGAPGFVSKALSFQADGDHTFDLALEPVKQPPASPPAPRPAPRRATPAPTAVTSSPLPPPVAPPAPPPATSTTTSHARQPIDTHDPYAP